MHRVEQDKTIDKSFSNIVSIDAPGFDEKNGRLDDPQILSDRPIDRLRLKSFYHKENVSPNLSFRLKNVHGAG